MKLGCQSITWGGVVGHPVGVTSVKDLYYLAHGSTENALREIAAAGYAGVEIFDGNLVEAAPGGRFRELLAETALELVAVYSGANFIFPEILGEELARIEKVAALAAEHGAGHLVVGGGAQTARGTTDNDYVQLAAGLDRVVEVADRWGLVASYHPHLSTIVETPAQIEKVMSRSRINFCPDIAHLAAAGGDPAALIRAYADRIEYVHLKDFTADPFAFLPLGEGALDLDGILRALIETGYDGWLTVEVDEHPSPRAAIETSRTFLSERLGGHLD